MGNDLVNPAGAAEDATCNMFCAGAGALKCGGPMRLNLYKHSPVPEGETEVDLSTADLRNARLRREGGVTVW